MAMDDLDEVRDALVTIESTSMADHMVRRLRWFICDSMALTFVQ
jgi:hypothetical protein